MTRPAERDLGIIRLLGDGQSQSNIAAARGASLTVQRMGDYAALADHSFWLTCGYKRRPNPERNVPL